MRRLLRMLNEMIEFKQYTSPTFVPDTFKYSLLNNASVGEKAKLGGLNRAMHIISRYFGYLEDANDFKASCAFEALKAWNGNSSEVCVDCEYRENCKTKVEILNIYNWFPNYLLKSLKEETVKLKSVSFDLPEAEQSDIKKHIAKINKAIKQLLQEPNMVATFPKENLIDILDEGVSIKKIKECVNKIDGLIKVFQEHNFKKNYFTYSFVKNIDAKQQIYTNRINYISIVSSAMDYGPLKRRYLVVDSSKDIFAYLSDSKVDKPEKLVASYLLFKNYDETATVNETDVINWVEKGKSIKNKTTEEYFDFDLMKYQILIPKEKVLTAGYFLVNEEDIEDYIGPDYTIYSDNGKFQSFSKNKLY